MNTIHTLNSCLRVTTEFLNAVAGFSPAPMEVDQDLAQAWAKLTASDEGNNEGEYWFEERAQAGQRVLALVNHDGPQIFVDVSEEGLPEVSYVMAFQVQNVWRNLQRVIDDFAFKAMGAGRGDAVWDYHVAGMSILDEDCRTLLVQNYATNAQLLDSVGGPEALFWLNLQSPEPVVAVMSVEVVAPTGLGIKLQDGSTQTVQLRELFSLVALNGGRPVEMTRGLLPALNAFYKGGPRFCLRKVEQVIGGAHPQMLLELLQLSPERFMNAFPVQILVQTSVPLETMRKHLGEVHSGLAEEGHPFVAQFGPVFTSQAPRGYRSGYCALGLFYR